jgi:hypothetical protein
MGSHWSLARIPERRLTWSQRPVICLIKVAAVATINEVFKMPSTAAIAGLIMVHRELIPGVGL